MHVVIARKFDSRNFVIVYLNFTIHTKDNWTHTAATTTVAAYHAMNYDKTYFVK